MVGEPRIGLLDDALLVDRPPRIEAEHQTAGDLDRVVRPEPGKPLEVLIDVHLRDRRAEGATKPEMIAESTSLLSDPVTTVSHARILTIGRGRAALAVSARSRPEEL